MTAEPTWLELVDTFTEEWAEQVAGGKYPDEAISPTPTELGWGGDLACLNDITSDARERLGSDPMVVIEALIRRIGTGRGRLPDDGDPETADYGLEDEGVWGWLNCGFSERDWSDKETVLRAEITKDDRVEQVQVSCSSAPSEQGETLTIEITGALVLPDSTKPFSMTLAVVAGSPGILLQALNFAA